MRYWVCPRCDDLQPVGAEHCSYCGQVLDDDCLFPRQSGSADDNFAVQRPLSLVAIAAVVVGMIALGIALALD